MAIVKAGKLEAGYDSQKLVSGLSREVFVSEPAQKIFLKTKHHFDSLLSFLVCKRSLTFAKNIIEYHKIKSKKSKAKALRKEISRSYEEQQQVRHD